MSSLEDGSQKDGMDYDTVVEAHSQVQVASKPFFAKLLSYPIREKQRTCAGLPIDSRSARDCQPISNWGQNLLHRVERENHLGIPGEKWMEGGLEGLKLVSLKGNPPKGGLRQGFRLNPEIECFDQVLQPMCTNGKPP